MIPCPFRWNPTTLALRALACAVFWSGGLQAQEQIRPLIVGFHADLADLSSSADLPASVLLLERKERLLQDWQARLEQVDYAALPEAERIDWHLLRQKLATQRADLAQARERLAEMEPLLAFRIPLLQLLETRASRRAMDPSAAAALLAQTVEDLKSLRRNLEQGRAEDDTQTALRPSPVLAQRTAATLGALQRSIAEWFSVSDGFQPDFGWWVRQPHDEFAKEIASVAEFLRKEIAGIKGTPRDPLVGDPIGASALAAQLAGEMIPYSAEELLEIARQEFAWCEAEMAKAAAEMGCADGKEALARIKTLHAPPGGQPAFVIGTVAKAIEFLKDRQLVTIPPLAEETWGLSMLSVHQQRSLPYAVYSRPDILIAFPHESMPHEDKLMSMRGNNAAFLHTVAPHELIPGHHLQAFMARRHATHRQPFSTPFLVEGWALHWEMLLWDLGYAATPEQKTGALFWRMHRCARIIVTLQFHLGAMQPQEMVDFLVERVGHEPSGAAAEVRRYIGGSYGPLYQVAYMTGGLQLRSLYHELVRPGQLTPMQFHDAVLREGPIPIEMIRAALIRSTLPQDWSASWRFAD